MIIVILLIALGYIISSKFILKNEKEVIKSIDKKDEPKVDILNEKEKNEENEKTDRFENIVLNSKIGNEVLSKFSVSNIYSKILYDKIDENGLSDEAKMIYTYVTIVSNYDYHNMIKSSDDIGGYITKEDFETVYKSLFGKNSSIEHRSVITDKLYNKEKEYYEYLTFGYGGIEFNFIVEVPFEIREYNDKLDVLFYRFYGTSTSELKKDGTQEQKVELYENSTKEKQLYSSSDVKLQDNDSQKDYIKSLIDDGEINKDNLEIVTYTLNEENDEYYITDVNKY